MNSRECKVSALPTRSWWQPASFLPRHASENAWAQVAATSLVVILPLAAALVFLEPSNGNQSSFLGDLWWGCVWLVVAAPLYLVVAKILGGGAGSVVAWGVLAAMLGAVEFVWYGLACAGSW